MTTRDCGSNDCGTYEMYYREQVNKMTLNEAALEEY